MRSYLKNVRSNTFLPSESVSPTLKNGSALTIAHLARLRERPSPYLRIQTSRKVFAGLLALRTNMLDDTGKHKFCIPSAEIPTARTVDERLLLGGEESSLDCAHIILSPSLPLRIVHLARLSSRICFLIHSCVAKFVLILPNPLFSATLIHKIGYMFRAGDLAACT